MVLKTIANVWREIRFINDHRLMDTRLTEKHFNKDGFSRMNVSLVVQVLITHTHNMIQTVIADDNAMKNIRLNFDRHNEMLNLMSKVNLLAVICNGTLSESNHFTKFTP